MRSATRRLCLLGTHLSPTGSPTTAATGPSEAAVLDEIGILGWPNLGLSAPEYRHAPRLTPGSADVNAHLEEHGFVRRPTTTMMTRTRHSRRACNYVFAVYNIGIQRYPTD